MAVTSFFTVIGQAAEHPIYPTIEIDMENYQEFCVIDTKAGRSAVAKAMNHGNPGINFCEVRAAAEAAGCVEKAKLFQGVALSDTTCEGTMRFLIRTADARPTATFTIQDPDPNVPGAKWHVFQLANGKELTEFPVGGGFLMISPFGSFIEVILLEGGVWRVRGGGNRPESVYLHFLREAKKEAIRLGILS